MQRNSWTKGRVAMAVLPVAAIAIVAVLWSRHERTGADDAATPVPVPAPQPTAAATPPLTSTASVAPTPPELNGTTDQAAATATQQAELRSVPPAFDLVRVDPQGRAIVAGTAAPGAVVSLLIGEIVLASVTADGDGNFVVIFDAPPGEEPQSLALVATDPQGGAVARSESVVLLLPKAVTPTAEPASSGAAPAGIAATAMVRDGVVEVTPTDEAAGKEEGLSLGAITYGSGDTLAITGRGAAGAVLRAYTDETLAAEATVGADGRWTLDLTAVPPGLYRLRLDLLAASGGVESRIETPFQRDIARPLSRDSTDFPAPAAGAPGRITVQPGNNLWTIAKLHYGEGTLYAQIFTANDGLLRDPNLIYPGQVLDLPASPSVPPAASGGRP